MIEQVASDEQWDELRDRAVSENKPLIVQFSAVWCGPCRSIYPDFERLSIEAEQRAIFAKVDVDRAEKTTESAGVSAMPTFHAYHGDELLASVRGANREKLVELVSSTLQRVVAVNALGATQTASDVLAERNVDAAAVAASTNDDGCAEQAEHVADVADDGEVDAQLDARTMAEDCAGRVVLIESDADWNVLVSMADQVHLPVVAQFSASWCAPCKLIYPVFGEHCQRNAGKAIFAKVDTDRAQGVTREFGVQGIPHFTSVRNGCVLDSFSRADARRLEQLVAGAVVNGAAYNGEATEQSGVVDYPENDQPVYTV